MPMLENSFDLCACAQHSNAIKYDFDASQVYRVKENKPLHSSFGGSAAAGVEAIPGITGAVSSETDSERRR
jgi:hypothetical protein